MLASWQRMRHRPALVLRRVAEALRKSYGVDLRAGSLAYNLLTLRQSARGVQLAAVHTPAEPFVPRRMPAVSFGVRMLMGRSA